MKQEPAGSTSVGLPDVTVVVITYNDASRLPRAVRSLQRQTLRALEIVVVDDASSDDTEAVVRRLAVDDPRIRYERLAENSGGCSAPRNRGLELARAPWVMFCDSDDEYERHACKNLLEAAERTGAQVVCGTAERVDARTGRVKRWRPEVHEREQVADGLAALPDLLYDTISVNKIYAVDLLAAQGIRFPEGLLFEDQLFTLEAMAAAQRVATIPEVVYRWYVDRLSEEPSITQRRNEARNVESRIEVNRRIDAFLAARGLADVQRVKDLKFLRHDLYLYLASMLEVDDETARTLMSRLRPYVQQTDLHRAWELRPALRVAIYHLLAGDLEGVRAAMRFVKWASVVDVPIERRDGRTYWASPLLDDGPEVAGRPPREWLDVTDLGLLDIPFTQRRYLHRLDSVSVNGRGLAARGTTLDYDGVVEDCDALELRLLIAGDRTALTVPARWTGRDGTVRVWEAVGPLTDHLQRALADKDRGTVAVAMSRGDLVNVTAVRAQESSAPRVRLPFPGPRTWTGADAIELGPYENGAVGWRAARTSPWRARADRVRLGWLRIPGATRLATFFSLVGRDALPSLAHRVGRLLPMRPLVVVEPGARVVDANVRRVAGELSRQHPELKQAWVFAKEPGRLPSDVLRVRAGSARHAWLVARARLRLVDGSTAATVSSPPRSRVLAVRTEVPVHRIGLDDPSILVSRAAVASVRRRARQWISLAAASPASGGVTAEAFGFGGAVVPAGIARMDAAVRELQTGTWPELRRRLDLPPDRPVIVHLPADRPAGVEVLDVEQWANAVGSSAYLVLRHGSDLSVPTRLRHAVRMLAEDDDLAGVIGVADLVISDFSPLIGDAALVDRPIILFQPDREVYVNRTHGVYPGLDEVGPVVETMDALVAEVERWRADPQGWDEQHAPGRRAWAADRVGPDDGGSAARLASAVLP